VVIGKHLPTSCAEITKNRSTVVTGTISPYPIVVIVVVAQYAHATYCANLVSLSSVSGYVPWLSANTSTQVVVSSFVLNTPSPPPTPPLPPKLQLLFCTACTKNHPHACQCANVSTTTMNFMICHAPCRMARPRSSRAIARVAER
jgi:hypothetical protein